MLGCFEQRFSKSFGFRSKWLKLFWKLKILELEVWALTHPPPTKTLSFHNQNQLFFFVLILEKIRFFICHSSTNHNETIRIFFFFARLEQYRNESEKQETQSMSLDSSVWMICVKNFCSIFFLSQPFRLCWVLFSINLLLGKKNGAKVLHSCLVLWTIQNDAVAIEWRVRAISFKQS